MSSKRTISVVLIVKDEEAVLEACLKSVAWADEIVVYDTGSTDRTVETARRYTDVVVEGYWDDHFAAARNRALAHATSEWVLSIDADEVFEGDPVRMRNHLGRGGATVHSVVVHNVVDRRGLPLGLGASDVQTAASRVFRAADHVWIGRLHEQPAPRAGAHAGPGVSALPDVRLRHVGYAREVVDAKNKTQRNVGLAQSMVDDGRAAGLSRSEMEDRQAHLARSLVWAGRRDEAMALSEGLLAAGFEQPQTAVLLARTVFAAALELGDDEGTDRWLRVWEENDANPAFARTARAHVAAQRGDARAALDAIEGVPTTTVNQLGERVSRTDLVRVEVWARCALGQRRRAAQVAQEAARRGVSPGAPAGLVRLLGRDRVIGVLRVLPDHLWGEYVTGCVMAADAESLQFLRWMHDVRPGDPKVLGGVAVLTPTLPLEDAARWAVDFRRVGLAERCPLVAIALDDRIDARQRALAGALAVSAYGDERALPGLEAALALVDDAEQHELLAQLDVVAPGLVGVGTPA